MLLDIFISGEFPGLNEVVAANRANRYHGAKQKRAATEAVYAACRNLRPIHARCSWHFTWVCKDKRRDPDNIASACKFVFDGLQSAGVIENDGWSQVASISHAFEVGDLVGVSVTATEVQQ